jgi:hypothetical protein
MLASCEEADAEHTSAMIADLVGGPETDEHADIPRRQALMSRLDQKTMRIAPNHAVLLGGHHEDLGAILRTTLAHDRESGRPSAGGVPRYPRLPLLGRFTNALEHRIAHSPPEPTKR